jgi:hypothetical protein
MVNSDDEREGCCYDGCGGSSVVSEQELTSRIGAFGGASNPLNRHNRQKVGANLELIDNSLRAKMSQK